MMRKLFLSLVLLVLTTQLHCPTIIINNSTPAPVPTFKAGDLDGGFATAGTYTTNLGDTDLIHTMQLQADGKILIGGTGNANVDWYLQRLSADGALDTSFANGGTYTVNLGGGDDIIYTMQLQADGKILIAGRGNANVDWYLQRLSADGALDTSFANGGTYTVNLGGGNDTIYTMQMQADGKILIAGRGNAAGDWYLQRLSADGALDTSFANGGTYTVNLGGGTDTIYTMQLQADGKILIAGTAGANVDWYVRRLDTTGALDTSFGDANNQYTANLGGTDIINTMQLQADGKILIAGTGSLYWYVRRLDTTGVLDTSFATGGTYTDSVGGRSIINTMRLQADGKILIAGRGNANVDWYVMRLDTAGALDTSFATAGTYTVNLGGSLDIINTMQLQSEGKILIAGGGGANDDWYVRRLGNYIDPLIQAASLGVGGLI
jgi:uncharacterized delta-60 repeat protein